MKKDALCNLVISKFQALCEEIILSEEIQYDVDEFYDTLWNIIIDKVTAYVNLGEYEKALEVINHYFDIEKDPMPEAYCTKGEIYEQMGMMKEAEEYMALYEKYKREE